MSTISANLRAINTDPANPTAGRLVGTAEVDDSLPLLLAAEGRYFILAQGTFAYGGSVPAEYVEVQAATVRVQPAE